MNDPRKSRVTLALIAALFLVPVVTAVLLFFYAPETFSGRINYGTLVSPARPVPDLGLLDAGGAPAPAALATGKWTLAYLGAAHCDAGCEARLALTRQVRASLNQNRGRVERAYLAPDAEALARARAQLATGHPDLLFLVAGPAAAAFFQPPDTYAVFLVDPLGNWLMTYAGTLEPAGLQKDLKKLLRISQVG